MGAAMSSGGFDPKKIEPQIWDFWERGGYFYADAPEKVGDLPQRTQRDADKKSFVIDIPPPNVTGALHLGHALNNTCQDILIRRARMQGFEALWMPGTDHAGIATQAVVERRLKEEQGLTRHEIGREGLVQRIWEWKDEYNARIIGQLRKMGFSCDWRRTRFTLDEFCARAVYEAFFEFFKAGLIYRGLRLVNWDAALQTAVADDEIEHKTVKTNLWHIRYPVLQGSGIKDPGSVGSIGVPPVREGSSDRGIEGSRTERDAQASGRTQDAIARATSPDAQPGGDYLVVATTRPETMLADTAVAVHPDDERYQHLIGGHVLLPLMNRPIPVVADPLLVKREFGTGCVKVTPGHDPNDYACWQRHQGQPDEFAIIDLLTPDGRINENGKGSRDQGIKGSKDGPNRDPSDPRSLDPFDYSGMKKEDARKKVVADLEALGLLEKIEPYETEVGHSDRSKTPIEPLRSEQWFMRMDKLAESAMEAVRDGRVKFFPERYAKTYLDWLGEKRDWCISRQLWWGHRIPVWHRSVELNAGNYLHSVAPGLNCFDELLSADGPDYSVQVIRSDGVVIREPGRQLYRITSENAGEYDVYICYTGGRRNCIELLEMAGFGQDSDVLDTWFSSALWPISTLGWPDTAATSHGQIRNRQSAIHNESAIRNPQSAIDGLPPAPRDCEYFFPTDVLCTGRGIITLWVARMVMMSLYFTKRVPFAHVYIHPIIQDAQGRTMSKSLGNGVDPLDLIELYGADAVRFTCAQLASETQDVRMPVTPVTLPDGRTVNSSERFELARNFITKIWQAATGFILPNLEQGSGIRDQGLGAESERDARKGALAGEASGQTRDPELELEDRWILSRLQSTIAEIERRFERYQFNQIADALYAFFWNDFCDWYLELVKPRIWKQATVNRDQGSGESEREAQASGRTADANEDSSRNPESALTARRVLAHVLDQFLRLLHPIAPFVTEALWARLNEITPQRGLNGETRGEPALITAAWPKIDETLLDPAIEAEIADLQNVIRGLRDIRASINGIRSQSKQSAVRALPAAIIKARRDISDKLRAREAVIQRLGQIEKLEISPDAAKPPQPMSKIFPGVEVYVPLAGLADVEIEVRRLTKEIDETRGHRDRLDTKLANEGFVAKAPAAVIEKERARLAELNEKLATMQRNLAELQG
jgi:valyl-tRNA synthetase